MTIEAAEEKIPDGVALVMDRNALVETSTGIWRIKDDRLDPGPPERIKQGDTIKACGKDVPHPLCSGVIVRCSFTDGHYLITAGHSDLMSLDVRTQACAVIGLRPLSMDILDSHVLPLGGIRHYEDLDDRDLTIVSIPRLVSTIQAHKLPPEDFDVKVGQSVYVVGHPGGMALTRFSATIVSRVPNDPALGLRGMNLEFANGNAVRDVLSGAPVFDSKTNTLLGIIQGRTHIAVDRLIKRLIEQFTKALPLDDAMRSLLFWASLYHNKLADDATESPVLRSALERELPREWPRVGPADAANVRLERHLSKEIVERIRRMTDLIASLLPGDANAVALRGVLSYQLY